VVCCRTLYKAVRQGCACADLAVCMEPKGVAAAAAAGAMVPSTSRSMLTGAAQRMTSMWGRCGQTCTGTDVSKDCSAACRAVHTVHTCILLMVHLWSQICTGTDVGSNRSALDCRRCCMLACCGACSCAVQCSAVQCKLVQQANHRS
jgi:hypothetical protein